MRTKTRDAFCTTRMCWRIEVLPAPMHNRRSRSI